MAKPMKARKKGKRKKKGPELKLDNVAQRLAELVKPNPANALKKLRDFVFTRYFIVEEVVSRSYATSVDRNNVFGSPPQIQRTGYRTEIVLTVRPKEDQYLVVRELKFKGNSPVKAGDHIGAKIPKYEEKRDIFSRDACLPLNKRSRVKYVERDFRESEEAIEIMIHTPAGGTLRRDCAAHHSFYMGEDR